jgi:hypothetical protein
MIIQGLLKFLQKLHITRTLVLFFYHKIIFLQGRQQEQ